MGRFSKTGNYRWLLGVSILILFLLMVCSASLGSSGGVTPLEILGIIRDKIFFSGTGSSQEIIVFSLRIPRILLAALAGIGLAVVGTTFQGVFRNPMADPFILGVSSGAALGGSIGIIIGSSSLYLVAVSLTSTMAFAGALITIALLFTMAKLLGTKDITGLLLIGVALNFFCSSMISLLMFLTKDNTEKIVFWTMGSLGAANWFKVAVLLPVVFGGMMVMLLNARHLNGILVGEDQARSFGVPVARVRRDLILASTIMVGVIVSLTGIIGFIGLIIPHVVRIFVGADHRRVLPLSAVFGAMLLVFCDALARTIVAPAEIPVGVLTSILGAPFFIFLLIKSRRKGVS